MIPRNHSNSLSGGFFCPHECWTAKRKQRGQRRDTSRNATTMKSGLFIEKSSWYILSPFGHFRNFWDFVGIILLILDTIILPLQFVNENLYSTYPFLAVNARFAVFYWLTDIILAFFTSYLENLGLD